jgi:hypothetical protein
MCCNRRVIVEARGDESKEHANTLVRCNGNFQKFFENFDLFCPVSILQHQLSD